MNLGDNVGAGISMKFIRVDYAPEEFTQDNVEGSGTSFAVDVGTLWKLPKQRFNLGLSVTNMGPNIAFIDREQSDPLPFTRAWARRTRRSPTISATSPDARRRAEPGVADRRAKSTTRRSEIWHAGVEYRYVNLLAGAVGYVYDDDGDFSDPTYGLGFIYKDKLSLDYANVPQAETLERVHRWSLYFTF